MSGPVVAITGSTTGIGYAIAESFLRAGARVVINAHLADDGGAAARLCELGECVFIQADLATVAGARGFIEAAHDRFGRLDTLINNAGGYFDAPFAEVEEEAFERTMALNVRGYLFASQAFARMVPAGQPGASIVCIGSTNSRAAELNSVIYDSSKGAVLMMIRSLAVTLAGQGIRVNGIGPGIIHTPLTAKGLSQPGVVNTLQRQIPLGRIGQPEDIGAAAVFLASEGARYITGQMLYIDGGILAQQMSWDPQA